MADSINESWFQEGVATFGDRLEAARKEAGLSQDHLAQHLGVRNSTVRAWEQDEWEPRGNRMQMLAGMLNVSLMWLMIGKGPGLTAPDGTTLEAAVPMALAQIHRLRRQMQLLAQDMQVAEAKLETALGQPEAAPPI
jgi:transcriptional regulator with XRE-family HTH domain